MMDESELGKTGLDYYKCGVILVMIMMMQVKKMLRCS